jgi:hypothetical protein
MQTNGPAKALSAFRLFVVLAPLTAAACQVLPPHLASSSTHACLPEDPARGPCSWGPWRTVPFSDVDTFGDPTGTFAWDGRWVVTGAPIRRKPSQDEWSLSPDKQMVWSDGRTTALPSGDFRFYYPWLGWDTVHQRLHLFWFEEAILLDSSAEAYPWEWRPTELWYSHLDSAGGTWAAPESVATDSLGFREHGSRGLIAQDGGVHFAAQSYAISEGGLHYVSYRGDALRTQFLTSYGSGWETGMVENSDRILILSFGNSRDSDIRGQLRPGLALWEVEPSGQLISHRFAEIPERVRDPQLASVHGLGHDSLKIVIGDGAGGFGIVVFQDFLWTSASNVLEPLHPPLVMPAAVEFAQFSTDTCGSSHLVFLNEEGMSLGHALLDENGWSSSSTLTLEAYPFGFTLFSGQDGLMTLVVTTLDIDFEHERFRDSPMKLLTSSVDTRGCS